MFGNLALSMAPKQRASVVERDDRDDSALVNSLRGPKPLMTYFMWKVSREDGPVPLLSKFHWKGQPENPNTFTVSVEGMANHRPDFRYLQVGSTLRAKLSRNVIGLLTSQLDSGYNDGSLGSLAGAYRHCAQTLSPSYEFLSYDFGDGSPVTFERLILPFRSGDKPISHLLGLVLFDEGF